MYSKFTSKFVFILFNFLFAICLSFGETKPADEAYGIFLEHIQKPLKNNLTGIPRYFISKTAYEISTGEDLSSAILTGGHTDEILILNGFKNKLNTKEYSDFVEWYLSYFVFSQKNIIIDNGNSIEAGPFHGLDRYNKDNQFPLDGVVAAKNYLHNIPIQELTISDISNVHQMTLSKKSVKKNHSKCPENCNDFRDGSLGKLRNKVILWKAPVDLEEEEKKDPEERTKLEDISTSALGRKFSFHEWTTNSSPKNYAEISKDNPYITVDPSSYEAYYVRLGQWQKFKYALTPSTIKLIERAEKELLEKNSKIDYEIPYTLLDQNLWMFSEVGQYTFRKFIFDLLNYTLKELKNELATCKTNADVIWAATHFFRDFISIHPFEDGNGRTAKILLGKILNDYNIPAPIIVDPSTDVVYSYEDLYHSLIDSIALSNLFHNSLKYCLENDIFYGAATPSFTTDDLNGDLSINIETLITWISYFAPNEKLKTMGEFYKSYNTWLNDIAIINNGNLARVLNSTFFRMFNRPSSSIESYNFKMNYSYMKDEIKFSPLISHNYKKEDLLNFFQKNVRELSSTNKRESLKDVAINFHKFNKVVANLKNFDDLTIFRNINLLATTLVDINEKERECDLSSGSFLEVISRRPSEGFIYTDEQIFVPSGVDFESVTKVRFCKVQNGSSKLTTLTRINIFTIKIDEFIDGGHRRSSTQSISNDLFQIRL